MKAIHCKSAYQEGKADRLAHPLHAGMYKLIETRRGWERSMAELSRIRRYLVGEGSGYSLRHCTIDDFHQWTRDALLWRAYDVSFRIFPSIAALSTDGVATKTISCIDNLLRISWPNVLHMLDKSHRRLKSDQDVEVDLMNLDKSRTYRALREVDTWLYFGLIHLPEHLYDEVYPEANNQVEPEEWGVHSPKVEERPPTTTSPNPSSSFLTCPFTSSGRKGCT